MDKKYVIALLSMIAIQFLCICAQAYRWSSIESVTARYYELKNDRDSETKRLNMIIRQANGTVESQDANS